MTKEREGETIGRDDDMGWLCVCGNFEESGFHCEDCGREPPWGCDCSDCTEPENDDDEW